MSNTQEWRELRKRTEELFEKYLDALQTPTFSTEQKYSYRKEWIASQDELESYISETVNNLNNSSRQKSR